MLERKRIRKREPKNEEKREEAWRRGGFVDR